MRLPAVHLVPPAAVGLVTRAEAVVAQERPTARHAFWHKWVGLGRVETRGRAGRVAPRADLVVVRRVPVATPDNRNALVTNFCLPLSTLNIMRGWHSRKILLQEQRSLQSSHSIIYKRLDLAAYCRRLRYRSSRQDLCY